MIWLLFSLKFKLVFVLFDEMRSGGSVIPEQVGHTESEPPVGLVGGSAWHRLPSEDKEIRLRANIYSKYTDSEYPLATYSSRINHVTSLFRAMNTEYSANIFQIY